MFDGVFQERLIMQKDAKTGRVVRDDLTGQVHPNGTTVVRYHSPTKNGGSKWVVICGCPDKTEMVVWAESFKRGVVCRKCRNKKLSEAKTVHGHAGKDRSDTYCSWMDMLTRCRDENHKSFKFYGGKGIGVCDEWNPEVSPNAFENFLADMGERPEGHTIGRLDHSKGYSKENCEWQPLEVQANTKSSCHFLTYQGETLTWSQWSRKLGIDKTTIRKRVKLGWPVEEVLSKKDGRTSYTITAKGKTQTLMEWVKETGIPKSTLINRMKRGLSGDALFS